MTKRKCVSVVLLIILGAILLFVGICTIIANSQNDKSVPTQALSEWMGMIQDDALLKNIAIPGAHDAGTKGISYLGETQDRNTAQLLECGTRYLDLRVAVKNGQGLAIYHGPFRGVRLESVLNDVKTFLTNHPTEFVILDFQHFSDNVERETLNCLLEILSDKLVENTSDKEDVEFVDNLILGEVRGKCLAVWGDGYDQTENKFVFKRNDDSGNRTNCVIHSYYDGALNRKSSSAYIEQALPHYINLYKQQNSGLFVLQGQLTDGLFVFGPHFREATHNKNMNNYLSNLKTSDNLSYINIVIRDYVSPAKNCATLQLNLSKNNVKTESTTAFLQMLENNG